MISMRRTEAFYGMSKFSHVQKLLLFEVRDFGSISYEIIQNIWNLKYFTQTYQGRNFCPILLKFVPEPPYIYPGTIGNSYRPQPWLFVEITSGDNCYQIWLDAWLCYVAMFMFLLENGRRGDIQPNLIGCRNIYPFRQGVMLLLPRWG